MSDEDESCQVQVSGIPEHLTHDDIELFFESKRYCPNGGDVKSTRYSSSDVIVVTFCDRSGKQSLPFFAISISFWHNF